MSPRALICLTLFFVGCGAGDDGLVKRGDKLGDGRDLQGSVASSLECRACAETLERDSEQCGRTLDECTNVPSKSTDQLIMCFEAEGTCETSALRLAESCHRGCGDAEQADVEACTGGCFTQRATCAADTLRRADRCLETCVAPGCELCTAEGVRAFDACNAAAQACADACVRTHRAH